MKSLPQKQENPAILDRGREQHHKINMDILGASREKCPDFAVDRKIRAFFNPLKTQQRDWQGSVP
ncbi:MAG: hypothetical protein LWW81_03020 [Rhodocyclales bacterium]|nr:hypothetical protein [Rhodocyclales bacterium]